MNVSANTLSAADKPAPPVSGSHRIPSLDGLRALSIAAVLAVHLFGPDQHSIQGWLMHALAFGGVYLFFVISGFLITGLLLQEETSTASVSLRNFYVRRAFRIVPVAYVYIAVVFTLFPDQIGRINFLLAPLFLMNFSPDGSWLVGHFWTLSIEEQFYLVWPFLFVFARHLRLRLLVALIVGMPIILLLLLRVPTIGQFLTSTSADRPATGCLLAILAYSPRSRAVLQRIVDQRFFWLLLLPLALCLVLNDEAIFRALPSFTSLRFYNVARLLFMRPTTHIIMALVIFRVVTRPVFLLNNAIVNYIGRLSYSLYVWQQVYSHNRFTPGLVGLLLTFVTAIISYHWLEQPFLRLRHRFTRPRLAVQPVNIVAS